MRQHLGAGATPAFGDAGSLLQFIVIDQKWNGRVKTALKSCLRFKEAGAQGKLWTLRIQAQISRFADVALRDISQKEKNWKCSLCPEGFDTKKALTVHARHKDQYRSLLKYVVLGDECLACCKKFFNRTRLLAHVGNSRACKNTYLACFVPASEEEVQKLEDEDRENYRMLKSEGWHSSKAFLPMIRVCGPVLPECGTDGAAAMKGQMAQSHPSQRSSF